MFYICVIRIKKQDQLNFISVDTSLTNISAIVVDDEQEAVNYLVLLLEENYPEIKVVKSLTNSNDAITEIKKLKPELVFLDVQIDRRNGFDIVKELKGMPRIPYLIFVTAYSKYAIDAFKNKVLDYLVKPVDLIDFKRAVNKFLEQLNKDIHHQSMLNLVSSYKPKLKFNTRSGFVFLSPDDIIYCLADKNYTKICSKYAPNQLVSLNLGQIEKMLGKKKFWRCSRSHIVNIDYLHEIDRKKKECILLVNDQKNTVEINLKRIKDLSL